MMNEYNNPYEVKEPPKFLGSSLFDSLDISVVDIETTGLNPLNDRIISIGIYRSKYGKILKPFYCEIDPEIQIPPAVSALTGISNHSLKLKNAPTLDRVIDDIEKYIGESTPVAHYAQFDRSFVNPCIFLENGYSPSHWIESEDDLMLKAQFNGKGRKWLCTHRLAWHSFLVNYNYEQISLKNEALRYWLEPNYIRSQEPHNAKADALTTLRVFQHICSYVEHKMNVKTLEDLFALNDRVKAYSTLPFGKYQGEKIQNVPNDYIEYCLFNLNNMDYELGLVFQNELNERKAKQNYIQGDKSRKFIKGDSLDVVDEVLGSLPTKPNKPAYMTTPKRERKPIPEKVLRDAVYATASVKYKQNHSDKKVKPKKWIMTDGSEF